MKTTTANDTPRSPAPLARKRGRLVSAVVATTLMIGCAASAALTPDPLVVGDLEALTVLDALPEDATGLADTARDVFTTLNEHVDGVLPILALLRIENTIARGVLKLDPAAVVVATSGVRGE